MRLPDDIAKAVENASTDDERNDILSRHYATVPISHRQYHWLAELMHTNPAEYWRYLSMDRVEMRRYWDQVSRRLQLPF